MLVQATHTFSLYSYLFNAGHGEFSLLIEATADFSAITEPIRPKVLETFQKGLSYSQNQFYLNKLGV